MSGGAFEKIVSRAAGVSKPASGDYVKDGLLRCGVCGQPKQARVTIGGREQVVPCVCRCLDKGTCDDAQFKALQTACQIPPACVFDRADVNRAVTVCRRYAAKWDEAEQKGLGLLLWGDVGTGKSFCAYAIANALLRKGIPIFSTTFSRVLNEGFDRSAVVAKIRKSPLVIFDDLGAERSSGYALETVFLLVDERYRTGKPFLVTTNIPLAELKEVTNIDRRRIYDRILERCVPVHFDGGSKRRKKAEELLEFSRQLLGGDDL